MQILDAKLFRSPSPQGEDGASLPPRRPNTIATALPEGPNAFFVGDASLLVEAAPGTGSILMPDLGLHELSVGEKYLQVFAKGAGITLDLSHLRPGEMVDIKLGEHAQARLETEEIGNQQDSLPQALAFPVAEILAALIRASPHAPERIVRLEASIAPSLSKELLSNESGVVSVRLALPTIQSQIDRVIDQTSRDGKSVANERFILPQINDEKPQITLQGVWFRPHHSVNRDDWRNFLDHLTVITYELSAAVGCDATAAPIYRVRTNTDLDSCLLDVSFAAGVAFRYLLLGADGFAHATIKRHSELDPWDVTIGGAGPNRHTVYQIEVRHRDYSTQEHGHEGNPVSQALRDSLIAAFPDISLHDTRPAKSPARKRYELRVGGGEIYITLPSEQQKAKILAAIFQNPALLSGSISLTDLDR